MIGVSWREDCPVALDALSLVTVLHWGLDGIARDGQLVIAAAVAEDVVSVFRTVYQAGFAIAKVRPIDVYGADDLRSMEDDSTSGFNCRNTLRGTRWSEHAFGTAIDINPIENPYVEGTAVLPAAGAAFLDRDVIRPGMIVHSGPVVEAFRAIGWSWGGHWASLKDYQHFSQNGL